MCDRECPCWSSPQSCNVTGVSWGRIPITVHPTRLHKSLHQWTKIVYYETIKRDLKMKTYFWMSVWWETRNTRDLLMAKKTRVVVRLFIDTQNRLVTLHTVRTKTHEETDNNPSSVIYRPVGSTMQLVTKIEPPQFLPCSRVIGTETFSCQVSTS
jgi:hypothetical protein